MSSAWWAHTHRTTTEVKKNRNDTTIMATAALEFQLRYCVYNLVLSVNNSAHWKFMGKMSTETKTYKVKCEYERVGRKMCESNGKSTNNKIIHEKARIRFADYQFTATKIMEIDKNMHTHTTFVHIVWVKWERQSLSRQYDDGVLCIYCVYCSTNTFGCIWLSEWVSVQFCKC